MYSVNGDHGRVVLDFLRKRIRQSGEPPHAHPHRQVMSFNVAGADMFGIRIAAHGFHLTPDAASRGVTALLFVGRSTVNLLQLGINSKCPDFKLRHYHPHKRSPGRIRPGPIAWRFHCRSGALCKNEAGDLGIQGPPQG